MGYTPALENAIKPLHWTKSGKYGSHRPIAVIRYRDRERLEEDLNFLALTENNRWTCTDPIMSEGEYGYTVVYNLVPKE